MQLDGLDEHDKKRYFQSFLHPICHFIIIIIISFFNVDHYQTYISKCLLLQNYKFWVSYYIPSTLRPCTLNTDNGYVKKSSYSQNAKLCTINVNKPQNKKLKIYITSHKNKKDQRFTIYIRTCFRVWTVSKIQAGSTTFIAIFNLVSRVRLL